MAGKKASKNSSDVIDDMKTHHELLSKYNFS